MGGSAFKLISCLAFVVATLFSGSTRLRAETWQDSPTESVELKPIYSIDADEVKALSGDQKQNYLKSAKPIIARIKVLNAHQAKTSLLVLFTKAQTREKEWPTFADELQSTCESTVENVGDNKAPCDQLVQLRDRTIRQNGTH